MARQGEEQRQGRILLVEDEEDFAFGLRLMLRKVGFEFAWVASLAEARDEIEASAWDLILLDLSLPDGEGVETLKAIQSFQPGCPIVVLTGLNDAELAVQALRIGATNYLTKPIRREDLLHAIDDTLSQSKIHRKLEQLQSDPRERLQVLGNSPAWRAALEMVQAAAESPRTTVLLTGEPGVGKEVCARLIHESTYEDQRPFMAINVACLSETLVESELFGHEAGAFTGARTAKRGVLEMAQGGTLFLDEIGELPGPLQPKLLRVLEGHTYRRIGGEKELTPDFRLISATNRSLPELVEDGGFRTDLYHRIRVLEIELPPLRQRGKDLEKLALYFLARLGAEMGYVQATIAPRALEALEGYHWPGNVRELRNVIERALVLSRTGDVEWRHLPQELRQGTGPGTGPSGVVHAVSEGVDPNALALQVRKDWTLDTAIFHHIVEVLRRCEGNVSHAAEQLEITRQTLRRRIRKYVEQNPEQIPLAEEVGQAP